MKKVTVTAAIVSLFLWACNSETKDSVEKADSANKANIDSPSTKQPVMADEATSSFLVDASNGQMTEIQLGELGQQKGTNQKVKDFAAMMVHDHSAVNEQVKALAAQRNVTLPTAISEESQKKVTDLSEKKTKDFDKDYMDAMVKKHEGTVDMLEKSADKVNDTEVKTFINNTLPKVREHLEKAKEIRKSLK